MVRQGIFRVQIPVVRWPAGPGDGPSEAACSSVEEELHTLGGYMPVVEARIGVLIRRASGDGPMYRKLDVGYGRTEYVTSLFLP